MIFNINIPEATIEASYSVCKYFSPRTVTEHFRKEFDTVSNVED